MVHSRSQCHCPDNSHPADSGEHSSFSICADCCWKRRANGTTSAARASCLGLTFFGSGAKIPRLGGRGAMDCAHVAEGTGKFIEGKGVALVADLLGHRGAGALLRGFLLSSERLENRAGGHRVVLFRQEHGRKGGDAGHRDFVLGRAGENSTRSPRGSAVRHADICHRNINSTWRFAIWESCIPT